ncbi:MAG TPA: hypothetical protein VF529_10565 [Solirubrobacteraceae bacterium]|jgi:hypothetical protein
MRVHTGFLAVAAAVAVAGMTAPTTASASQSFSCSFVEQSGRYVPSVPALPGTGGGGTYTFGGAPADLDAHCTFHRGTVGGATTAKIVSTGRFENDVCGTGRWFGNTATRPVGTTGPGTYIDFADPAAPDVTQLDYRIDFVAGEGPLRGGNLVTKDGVTPATTGTVDNASSWRVTGVAEVRPPSPVDCVLRSSGTFLVSGHIDAVTP